MKKYQRFLRLGRRQIDDGPSAAVGNVVRRSGDGLVSASLIYLFIFLRLGPAAQMHPHLLLASFVF